MNTPRDSVLDSAIDDYADTFLENKPAAERVTGRQKIEGLFAHLQSERDEFKDQAQTLGNLLNTARRDAECAREVSEARAKEIDRLTFERKSAQDEWMLADKECERLNARVVELTTALLKAPAAPPPPPAPGFDPAAITLCLEALKLGLEDVKAQRAGLERTQKTAAALEAENAALAKERDDLASELKTAQDTIQLLSAQVNQMSDERKRHLSVMDDMWQQRDQALRDVSDIRATRDALAKECDKALRDLHATAVDWNAATKANRQLVTEITRLRDATKVPVKCGVHDVKLVCPVSSCTGTPPGEPKVAQVVLTRHGGEWDSTDIYSCSVHGTFVNATGACPSGGCPGRHR